MFILSNLTLSGVLILFAIFALAFGAAFVFFERAVALRRAHIDETDFVEGIFNSLGRGAIREALAICDETPGPVAHLTAVAIRRRELPAAQLASELEQAGFVEISRMERRVSVLTHIAHTAPLIGLLGTVLAILDALLSMNRDSPFWLESDAVRCLASGVSTTAAGLLVAIPCYFGMNLLANKIEKLIVSMKRARADLLARLEFHSTAENNVINAVE